MILRTIFCILLYSTCAFAQTAIPHKVSLRGVEVNLNSPHFADGTLSTTLGGTVEGERLFLQAKNISYTNRQKNGVLEHFVEASGDILFRYQGSTYTGKHIRFNLTDQTGTVDQVITDAGVWFISGKLLEFLSDGSKVVYDCSITTDENDQEAWRIFSPKVTISPEKLLHAANVQFLLTEIPIFWVPFLTKDLSKKDPNRIHYRFRHDSKRGPRLGLSYQFQTGHSWRHRVLFDIALQHGAGGGFTSSYKNPENEKETFSTYNYYANDFQTQDSDNKERYRFEGKYTNAFVDNQYDFWARYDVLSDSSFPSDFEDRGLDSARAKSTEMQLSKGSENYKVSANAKVRVNEFQSVKEQLPLFQYTTRPLTLGTSNIVLDNRLTAGYLNFKYAKETKDAENFHSSRASAQQKLYRQFSSEVVSFTPYAGYRAIGYGNSPTSDSQFLLQGITGFEMHTRLKRQAYATTQTVEPYLQYDYATTPTSKPNEHYLFDLRDGLYRQNCMRFGFRNFNRYYAENGFSPQLNLDLYAKAYFNTPQIVNTIPRLFLDATVAPSAYSLFYLESAYDTKRQYLDHLNARTALTLSEGIALKLEYRYRSPYSWRKLDKDNIMLDSYRSETELLHSILSDKRHTFLTHAYFKLTPSLAFELASKHGWGRKLENKKILPNYNEYETNFIYNFRDVMNFTFSVQKKETGLQYSFYFDLGAKLPSTSTSFTKLGQGNYTLP